MYIELSLLLQAVGGDGSDPVPNEPHSRSNLNPEGNKKGKYHH